MCHMLCFLKVCVGQYPTRPHQIYSFRLRRPLNIGVGANPNCSLSPTHTTLVPMSQNHMSRVPVRRRSTACATSYASAAVASWWCSSSSPSRSTYPAVVEAGPGATPRSGGRRNGWLGWDGKSWPRKRPPEQGNNKGRILSEMAPAFDALKRSGDAVRKMIGHPESW